MEEGEKVLFSHARTTPEVIVHADDFGIEPEQSRRILACSSAAKGEGALNSLSVIVTSPRASECLELLRPFEDNLLVGLHVNVVEGPCAADKRTVPFLVDDAGVFKRGFVGLFVASALHPARAREQLEREIGAQLDAFLEALPAQREHLRIDSHQHFHLIPAVFDGLVSAVESRECALEYLRIPAEPISPFAAAGALLDVPPVNYVKHAVLNALWKLNAGKVDGIRAHTGVFCGINFSGRMTLERVGRVLPAFRKLARARRMPLELLFHPGGVDDENLCLNPALAGFVAFYRSQARAEEARAIREIDIR